MAPAVSMAATLDPRGRRASERSAFLGMALFLLLQLNVWLEVARAGLHASSGIYGSVFYGFTCFHALHVAAGLAVLAIVAAAALRGRNLTARYGSVRLCAMFWHFVDAIWV